MRPIILISSCQRDRTNGSNDAIRETWIKTWGHLIPHKFVLGRTCTDPLEDELILDVDDKYEALPFKTREGHRWALENKYDFVFQCFTDTYINIPRLLSSGFEKHDYMGHFIWNEGEAGKPRYASGGAGYWLSSRASQVLINNEPDHWAEDLWVGTVMKKANIPFSHDMRFWWSYKLFDVPSISGDWVCKDEDMITAHLSQGRNQYDPQWMQKLHSVTAPPPLEDITLCITSFLRPGYLSQCLKGIKKNIPECPVIVVDDSGEMPVLDGPKGIELPFDSGLTTKRNAGVKACTTKYWLCASDDFDFSTSEARQGIERLVRVLDAHSDIDVVTGHVDNRFYEGIIEYAPGSHYIVHRLNVSEEKEFHPIDLGFNYFIARTDRIVPWDERMKIGGEHGDWFLEMKQEGRKVVFVPNVNINTLKLGKGPDVQDSRYETFRDRGDLGEQIFREKRNVQKCLTFPSPDFWLPPDTNKVIQGLWIGKLTTMERLGIQSHLSNGHEFHLYTYGDVGEVPKGTVLKNANEIVPESDMDRFQNLANFSDWFRANLVYKKGGWYSDLDSVCLKHFDFTDEFVFCNGEDGTDSFTAAIFKAPAGCKILQWIIEEQKRLDWKTCRWGDLGPYMFYRAISHFSMQKFVHPLDTFVPIHGGYAEHMMIDPKLDFDFGPKNYAIHLFNEGWRRMGLDKDGIYPPSCIYEVMKRRYLAPPLLVLEQSKSQPPKSKAKSRSGYGSDGLTIDWFDLHPEDRK